MQVVLWLTDRDAEGAAEGADAPSIVSTVCPTAGPVPKQLPSLVHDDRGNTLYEEPSIAWMHIRIAQVRLRLPGSDNSNGNRSMPHDVLHDKVRCRSMS